MKTNLCAGTFLFICVCLNTHINAQDTVIPLWIQGAPGSEEWTQEEAEYVNPKTHRKLIRNVTYPTLTAFFPEKSKANGVAVVICPGGGFRWLSWDHEGIELAQWLVQKGFTAFVLKYRLLNTGATEEEFEAILHSVMNSINNDKPLDPTKFKDRREIHTYAVADGIQAMKIVRENASKWDLDPDRIGIMGFSAGARVTMGVILENNEESKPNFAATLYGGGTKPIGNETDAQIPADAPPLFIATAWDDFVVYTCLETFTAWKRADQSAELHIYSKGGHGFGTGKQGMPVDSWLDRYYDWLQFEVLSDPVK